jgi:hypothetical protein
MILLVPGQGVPLGVAFPLLFIQPCSLFFCSLHPLSQRIRKTTNIPLFRRPPLDVLVALEALSTKTVASIPLRFGAGFVIPSKSLSASSFGRSGDPLTIVLFVRRPPFTRLERQSAIALHARHANALLSAVLTH